jgi:prepilin-type processing-associated H-X9-DG protein
MGQEWNTKSSVTGNYIPNTPAPLMAPYMPNNQTWICPKRRRGASYVVGGVTTGGNLDPSITGFISYGFNECGVFDQSDSGGNMVLSKAFKATQAGNTSDLMAVADCSGTIDPANGVNPGNPGAIWDTWWAASSGPEVPAGPSTASANFRMQSAQARHSNRSSVVWVDGHSSATLPSTITWGQVFNVFTANTSITASPGGQGQQTKNSDNFISSKQIDAQVWSGTQEY